MSEAPRKRSRGWIGWALIASVVLYPLSMGPVVWLAIRFDWPAPVVDRTLGTVYAPINWLRQKSETVDNAVVWYGRLWDR